MLNQNFLYIQLSRDLGKEFDITNLKRIRKFYKLFQKGAAVRHQLLYGYY